MTRTVSKMSLGEFFTSEVETESAQNPEESYSVCSRFEVTKEGWFNLEFLENEEFEVSLPKCRSLKILFNLDSNTNRWFFNGEEDFSHNLVLETITIRNKDFFQTLYSKIQTLYYVEEGVKFRLLTNKA